MAWQTLIASTPQGAGVDDRGGIAVRNGEIYVIASGQAYRWDGISWAAFGSGHGSGYGLTWSADQNTFYYIWTSGNGNIYRIHPSTGAWGVANTDPQDTTAERALAADGEYLYVLDVIASDRTNRILRTGFDNPWTFSGWTEVLAIDDDQIYGGMAIRDGKVYLLRDDDDGTAPIRVYDLTDGTYVDIGDAVDGVGLAFDGDNLIRLTATEVSRYIDFPSDNFLPFNDSWHDLLVDEGATITPNEYPSDLNGDTNFSAESIGVLDGVVYVGLHQASSVVVLELESDGEWDETRIDGNTSFFGMSVVRGLNGEADIYGLNTFNVNGPFPVLRRRGNQGSFVEVGGLSLSVSNIRPQAFAVDWSDNSSKKYWAVQFQGIASSDSLRGTLEFVQGSAIGFLHRTLAIRGDGRPISINVNRRFISWTGDEWELVDGVDAVPGTRTIRGIGVDEDGRVYVLLFNSVTEWNIYRSQTTWAARPPVAEYRRALHDVDTHYALEIHHPDLTGEYVRVVADNADHTIDGETYMALAFRALPPTWQDQQEARATIEIDNVGRELNDWIEASSGGRDATMRVMQVRRGRTRSEVIWELPALPVGVASISNESVRVSVVYRSGRRRPGIKWRHDSNTSPGLF